MIKYVDALKARRELGTLMDKAQYLDEYTVIKRANKPIAAIVSAQFLEGVMRYGSQLHQMILKTAQDNDLDSDVALALAQEAKDFAQTR